MVAETEVWIKPSVLYNLVAPSSFQSLQSIILYRTLKLERMRFGGRG